MKNLLDKKERLVNRYYQERNKSLTVLSSKSLIFGQLIQNSKILIKSIKLEKSFLKKILILFLLIACSAIEGNNSVAAQSVTGGVFIPRNGNFEGQIGLSHVLFNKNSGGMMSVITGNWPSFETVASLETFFKVLDNNSNHIIEVRQSFDRDPKILFLEEGNDRIGIRVLYKLYDSTNIYYGHAMTETWFYPDGQMFVTQAVMFENEAEYSTVIDARINIDIPKKLKAGNAQNKVDVKMNDIDVPGRFLSLTPVGSGESGLALYWRTGRMEHDTYIHRSSFGEKGAPTYFRWPDYFRQAYTQPTTPDYAKNVNKISWPPGGGEYIEKIVSDSGGVNLVWPIESKLQKPTASFNSVFRLAMVSDSDRIKSFVDAERAPLMMTVTGGTIYGNEKIELDKGYNDQEGCYEVRKTGSEPLTITLPENTLANIIRVKIVALSKYGAVNTTLDGKPIVPQLTSDGGIADDPLAPIQEPPEAPANAAMVTVKLSDKPQMLAVKEEDGIQLVYQSRDTRRNFAIYSSKSGPRWSSLEFSLVDGHATHMRAYGKKEWAFTENLIHWFAWMGYTPEQMLDQLRDFRIIKNGPDEIVFKYTSNNFNDGARSESIIRIDANSPAMQLNVATTFTVLNHWPYKSVQFFDGFPFRGVEPKDWWYENVLYMNEDNKWSTYKNVSQISDGDKSAGKSKGTHFTALYNSNRGNVLILTKNFKSKGTAIDNVICSNYIDLHMNVVPAEADKQSLNLITKGFQSSIEYEMAIWGDNSLTKEQAIEIGKRSINAGNLKIIKQ